MTDADPESHQEGRSDDDALLRAALAVCDGSSPEDAALPKETSQRLRGALAALHAIERLRTALAQSPERDPQLLAGSTVGNYEIGPMIGVGGMGEVYRAHDRRLDRTVALKTVGRQSRFDPKAVARFEREARFAAAVVHPNLVTLFELVDFEDRLYLAFELLNGETLQTRLLRGPLLPDEAAQVGEKVARGLAALHAAGLIHRDIKPGNIFLGGDGQVKLLDMGIARPVDRSADDTRTGLALLGTPAYMPPERICGGIYAQAGDVFCLGVVIYEAVTGRHPFRRDDLDATLNAIVSGESSLASLPGPFRRLFEAWLRKDPGLRPSAEQLAEALSDIRSGREPRIGGPSRSSILPLGLAAFLIAIAGGGVWLGQRTPPSQVLAHGRPAAAAQPSPEADVYRVFLEAQALVDDDSPAELKRAKDLYGQVITRAPDFAPGWAGYANLLQMISVFVDGVDPGKSQAEGMAAAHRALRLDPDLASAHQAMADLLSQQNDWAGAEAAIRRALAVGADSAEAHHSYSVSVLVPMGRLEEAERHSLRAAELQPSSGTYAEALGRVYFFQRRFDLAFQQWERVVARNPRELAALWRMGQAQLMLGRPLDALKTFAVADSFTPGIQKGQALIALARAKSGDIAGARAIRDQLLAARRAGRYVSPTLFGAIDVGLGDVDSAFQNLMEACNSHADWVRFAKVEPILDPIRSDPRFGVLLRCLKLGP
ncbi:MAG: serine/threonine-protein kinase [Vicinamibacteria bacterium]